MILFCEYVQYRLFDVFEVNFPSTEYELALCKLVFLVHALDELSECLTNLIRRK